MSSHRSVVAALSTLIAVAAPRSSRAEETAVVAPTPAAADTAPAKPGPQFELTSLRVLHDKGILSEADYVSAMKDLNDSIGQRSADATVLAVGKWSTAIYGFVEADSIYDTTQGLSEAAGGTPIARAVYDQTIGVTNYKGTHGQLLLSVRNSRLGFRMGAPTVGGVHPSAVVELDLLGVQPSTATLNQTFTSPTMRLRHAYGRIETPVLDVLFGQTWALLGWQGVYQPNTVEVQGVPGELYSRRPQLRLSKTIPTSAVTVEIAAAALMPPSPGSEVPEGQAGIRIAVNPWKGITTNGATATSVQPMSIAVTGDVRHFEVPNVPFNGPAGANNLPTPNPLPDADATANSEAIAIDVFIPVIPASSAKSRANSLSLNGEVVTGSGIADLYSSMTGGITFPNVPIAGVQNVVYPQNIDNGLVTFDNVNFNLHTIQWTSVLVGAQYYLPWLEGRMWLSGNFSNMHSNNTSQFADQATGANPLVANYALASTVRVFESWYDVNLFYDVADPVRVGAEFATFYDKYADGIHASNQRVQVSGWFLF